MKDLPKNIKDCSHCKVPDPTSLTMKFASEFLCHIF